MQRRTWLLAAITIATALPVAQPPLRADGPADAALSGRIDEFVRAEMKRQRVPGVAVGIVKDGAVVKAQGYGVANLEHDVAVTPDTIFRVRVARQAVHRDRRHAAGGRWEAVAVRHARSILP